jgi:hypothetical protein
MGPDRSDVDSRRGGSGRRLLGLTAWLTTPLLPEDYLALVDPLWSPRGFRARVEEVRPETDGAATVVLRPDRRWVDHRAGQTGAIVRLTPADGDFVEPSEVPWRLLFLTAGSGVTPVAAILRDLDAPGTARYRSGALRPDS